MSETTIFVTLGIMCVIAAVVFHIFLRGDSK